MSNYQDRFPDMLKEYLGEELYKKAKSKGLSDNRMMVWFHEVDRDSSLFKRRMREALDETEDLTESIDDSIENLREQIENLEDVKTGAIEDIVLDKGKF